MKDLKNIEDLFKETFNDFESTPPASLKAAVDSAINSKKRGLWRLPVVALLLVTIPLTYYLSSGSDIRDKKNYPRSVSADIQAEKTNTGDQESGSERNEANSQSQTGQNEIKSTSAEETERLNDNSTPKKQAVNSKSGNTPLTKTTTSVKQNGKTVADPKSPSSTPSGNTKKNKPVKTKKQTVSPDPVKQLREDKVTDASDKSGENPDGVNKTGISGNNPDNANAMSSNGVADDPSKKDTASHVADASKTPDSLNNTSLQQTTPPTPPVNNAAKNWTASVFAGPQFEIAKSTDKNYFLLDTKPSFRFSAELNRKITSGFGASAGIGYYTTSDSYTRVNYVTDSVPDSYDTIPIYDQQNPDSIVGYEITPVYDSTEVAHQFQFRSSSITIPLYISKQFEINEEWGILVNAGVVYRMSKVTGGPVSPYGQEPVITRNSLMVSGRVHATYKWNSWMFSLGLNAGYYVKPPLQYEGIKSNRSFFTPEIGIHFTF